MIPPLVRRCPACGHLTWRSRFATVEDGVWACPDCDHRFSTVDAPWLQ